MQEDDERIVVTDRLVVVRQEHARGKPLQHVLFPHALVRPGRRRGGMSFLHVAECSSGRGVRG